MQKKIALIVLLILGVLSVACGADEAIPAVEDVLESVVEELPVQLEATAVPAEDSPREAEALASPIPPTYTPQPTTERQFFKPGEGSTTTATGGTRGSVTNVEGTRIAIPPGSGTYTVQAGDQLAEIAIEFGVSLDDIICANEISDMDHIEVGQVLIIPFSKN